MSGSGPPRIRFDRCWSRRRFLQTAGATGVGTAALLAACGGRAPRTAGRTPGGTSGAQAIKRGGALSTFLNIAPSEDWEVAGLRSGSKASQTALTLVYSGLLRLKLGEPYKYADHAMEGALASTWEQPDNQTFVFHLRPGVKFHDKPPVNARELSSSDVKFSLDRLVGSRLVNPNWYSSIASIDAPDPQTVIVKMKAPDATLLLHLSVGFAWVVAKEAGKADAKGPMGMDYHDPSTVIGTGPFMLDHYEPGGAASFVRNPSYFESGLPYLDRVDYKFITDSASEVAVLQSGQATLGQLPAGSEADFKSRNPKYLYDEYFFAEAWYHGMRSDQKPFNDVRVRRALAMAYDQDEVKQVWGTADAPSSFGSLTAVAGDAYLPADKLGDNAQWWKPNLSQAKQLLSAAGYPNGFEVDYNDSDCCTPNFLPEQLASDLAKIGVKINIKVKQHAAYVATTGRGDYEGMAGSQVPIYDADDWFGNLLPGIPNNVCHVNDATVNDLTTKERAELDPQKRLDIIHDMVRYLAGQVYHLVQPQNILTGARQPFVKNYAPRVGYQPTFEVVWLDR